MKYYKLKYIKQCQVKLYVAVFICLFNYMNSMTQYESNDYLA